MTPVDFQEPVDLVEFHSEANKVERAVAAYESMRVRGDNEAAMRAALKEYARMSPLLPTFIVQND